MEIMKYIIVALLLMFIICSVANAEQDTRKIDGDYWRSLDETQQLSHIAGFIEGMHLGNIFTYSGMEHENPDLDRVGKQVDRANKRIGIDPEFGTSKEYTNLIKLYIKLQDEFLADKKQDRIDGIIAFDTMYDFLLINVSDEQIIDGLNEFYNDFENRSIRVHMAVSLVLRRIKGGSEEFMESLIEAARRDSG